MVFESTTSWPSFEGEEREIPPPLSSYGFQKLAVEYFARAAHDQYGLPYTIVRPFNCVGIGEARALGEVEVLSGNVKLAMSHVVPDLVQKVLKGQDPLHLLGDGSQVRHYTYGGDLARGIVTAMEHPAALNDDFNLSTAAVDHRARAGRVDLAEDQGCRTCPSATCPTTPFEHDVQRRVPATEKARACARVRGHDDARRDARRGHPLDRSRRWPTAGSDRRAPTVFGGASSCSSSCSRWSAYTRAAFSVEYDSARRRPSSLIAWRVGGSRSRSVTDAAMSSVLARASTTPVLPLSTTVATAPNGNVTTGQPVIVLR